MRGTTCRNGFVFLAVCALVLGLAAQAAAQSAGTGTIFGRVTDEKGGAIPGAKVTVRNMETNISRQLTTDDQGGYRAVLLQPGLYEVEVQAQGFATVKRIGLRLEVGASVTANVEAKVAAVTETVTVTEAAPITDPEKVEVGSTVSQKQIEELPTNGRRWDNFVLLTPGVSPDGTFGNISYRGISGLLNNNTIDGADNNQAFFSEARGRTRVSNTYSQSAVKEFQVGLSNFSAEFGRAAGGTVNAVTKSGTNKVHGEVFYFIRDDTLQGREPTLSDNLSQPLKNKDRRQQYGLSLGLPIVKDKLFFFGNWDQQHRTESYLVRSNPGFFNTFISNCTQGFASSVQLATNCQALLEFQQEQSGQQPRKRINNVALGKMDYVISPNHTFNGSYNWHRWRSPNGIQTQQLVSRGLSDNGTDIVKTDSFIARLVSVFGSSIVNEAKFQFGRDFEAQTPNSNDPRTTITNGISFGRSEFLPRSAWPDEKRFQWMDTISWLRGRHTWKFGFDINYVRDQTINIFNGGGAYSYQNTSLAGSIPAMNATTNLAQDCPTATRTQGCVPFTLNAGVPVGKHWGFFNQAFDVRGGQGDILIKTTDWNFFVQDTIKWTPTITLNLGLRYEFEKLPGVKPINFSGTEILGYPQFPESQRINLDKNNFGPRVAIAWDIGGRQKNIVRAGGGLYYGRTPNALIRSHLLENGVALPSFSFGVTQRASGPVYPAILSAPSGSSGTRSVIFMAGDFVQPFISMVDVAYERELSRNIGVSVTYVYTRANHLIHSHDINLNPSTSTVTFLLDADGSNTTTSDRTVLGSSPFYAGQRPLLDTLPGVPANTRLGSVLRQTSDLNARYHGLIIEYRQRSRFGLTINSHFTYSKARDDGQGMGASPFAGRFEDFFDPFDRKRENTRSDFDLRRRFVTSFIWEPTSYWKISGPTWKAFFGDWSFNGVLTINDGQPFNPGTTGSLGTGAASSGTTPCPSASSTCATSTSTINGSGGSLRLGWLQRNFLETTGFVNLDFRVQKDFTIREGMKVRFIWEMFNAANRSNHPNRFNFVGTSLRVLASSTTGTVSNLTAPRTVVLRLDENWQGILDPTAGTGDLKICNASGAAGGCLNSASGVFFGARDMQFGLKFIF